MSSLGKRRLSQPARPFNEERPTLNDTTTKRWDHESAAHRIRHLRQRHALSEAAAQLLAPMIFGKGRQ